MSWGAGLAASLLVVLPRPATWIVALASFLVRGGILLFLAPIVVGGGDQALPDGVRLELDLLSERRFRNGVVHLHYSL